MKSDQLLEEIRPAVSLKTLSDVRQVFIDSRVLSLCERRFFLNLDSIVETIAHQNVPGDFFEAGVWRGGVAIYLKNLLEVHSLREKKLWLADTFSGFPPVRDKRHKKDIKVFKTVSSFNSQIPSVNEVQTNFDRFCLLDDKITFLEGDVADTLDKVDVPKLSLLHLDVDLYEPTRKCLDELYNKLSPGGFVIIDDYGVEFFNCREAVDEFRSENGINEPVQMLSNYIACWRKLK